MIPPNDSLAFNFTALEKALGNAKTSDELQQVIVNAPFKLCRPQTALIFLGIIVLLVVNKETATIDRIALSETELAKNTTDVSYVPFEQIKIPFDDSENIIAKAIRSDQPQDTTDWKYLFTPALTAEQARINQASGGIAYSAVYPLKGDGAMIFSYFQYQQNIGNAQHEFMRRYAEIVAKQSFDR